MVTVIEADLRMLSSVSFLHSLAAKVRPGFAAVLCARDPVQRQGAGSVACEGGAGWRSAAVVYVWQD